MADGQAPVQRDPRTGRRVYGVGANTKSLTNWERLVENAPDKAAAGKNMLHVSPEDPLAGGAFVEIHGFIYQVQGHPNVPFDGVAMNAVQRKILRVSQADVVTLNPMRTAPQLPRITMVMAEITTVGAPKPAEIDASEVTARLLRLFSGQVWARNQQIAFEASGMTTNFRLVITSLQVDVGGESVDTEKGYVVDTTAFIFSNGPQHPIKITGQRAYATNDLFKTKNLNFEQLGIGGLDRQFEAIFRRAFASRVYPPSIVQKLGIKHVKGILLFGPPGTGKTLIARQIGKMLNGKEPKIVNGPEVLNKYVGQSEENIRNLFAEADEEYRVKGEASELHIIIFDEIDAICKQRGSVREGTGVHDGVVNQLLTKIDGVDAINNILLIGMTNRRDLLDEALLRPGRLEVQIEIGLPDLAGRLQIIKIHTSRMSENSFLARDVDIEELAELTKNFSGAEIEGLVKDAVAYALNRQIDINDLSKPLDEQAIKVTMSDFKHSLDEIKPAFGAESDTLKLYAVHGILSCGDAFDHIMHTMRALVHQVHHSNKTPLLTCVLEGPSGSGKSSMAATVALESEFPFIKVISPESMVGYSEQAKSSQITRVFEDAYRSPLSVILVDDIERLLEYVAIGPRFSNAVLQTLLVLIKKRPPAGHKLLILGTSSSGEVMDSLGLTEVFNVSLHVPSLRMDEMLRVIRSLDVFALADLPAAVNALKDHYGNTVPIKRLLLWLELAKQDLEPGQKIPLAKWEETLRDLSS